MWFTYALLVLHKHLLYFFLSSLNYTCSKIQLDAYFFDAVSIGAATHGVVYTLECVSVLLLYLSCHTNWEQATEGQAFSYNSSAHCCNATAALNCCFEGERE